MTREAIARAQMALGRLLQGDITRPEPGELTLSHMQWITGDELVTVGLDPGGWKVEVEHRRRHVE